MFMCKLGGILTQGSETGQPNLSTWFTLLIHFHFFSLLVFRILSPGLTSCFYFYILNKD